jgi:hypothetical protein
MLILTKYAFDQLAYSAALLSHFRSKRKWTHPISIMDILNCLL